MISDTHTPYAYWSSDMTLSRVDGFFDNRSHRSCAVDASSSSSSSSSPKTSSFSSHVSNLLQGSFRFFSSYHFNRFSRNTITTEEEDSFSPLFVIESPAVTAAAAAAARVVVVLVDKDKDKDDDGETFFSPAAREEEKEDEILVVGKTKERRRSRENRNTATRSCSREEQKKLLRMHAYVYISLSVFVSSGRAPRSGLQCGDFLKIFITSQKYKRKDATKK